MTASISESVMPASFMASRMIFLRKSNWSSTPAKGASSSVEWRSVSSRTALSSWYIATLVEVEPGFIAHMVYIASSLFCRQTRECYRVHLRFLGIAARGEYARNLRPHHHGRELGTAELRARLEEDIARVDVREHEAVGIAHYRVVQLLGGCGLLVDGHVECQRAV